VLGGDQIESLIQHLTKLSPLPDIRDETFAFTRRVTLMLSQGVSAVASAKFFNALQCSEPVATLIMPRPFDTRALER